MLLCTCLISAGVLLCPTCLWRLTLPPSSHPRGAFVYLVHPNRTTQLQDSLAALYKHFLAEFPVYSVLLFHEGPTQVSLANVPKELQSIKWILLEDFSEFPANYTWEYHASQERW